MKLHNIKEVEDFLAVINSCKGNVYLTSPDGDKINLKSQLSQYIGITGLLSEKGDILELWADDKDDEIKLINYLVSHPEVA